MPQFPLYLRNGELLRRSQTRQQCCRNIVAEANVSRFAFPGNICCGSKNVSEFDQKHFASSANVCSFARRGNISEKMFRQQRFLVCGRLQPIKLPNPFPLCFLKNTSLSKQVDGSFVNDFSRTFVKHGPWSHSIDLIGPIHGSFSSKYNAAQN